MEPSDHRKSTADKLTVASNAKTASDVHFICNEIDKIDKAISHAFDLEDIQRLNSAKEQLVSTLKPVFTDNPDVRREYSDVLQSRNSRSIPWDMIRPDPACVAFLYNFSPFQDTGATVASKRIRDFGFSVDVIACSSLHKKKQDPTVEAIAEPYISSRTFLPLSPSWASWKPFMTYAVKASELAEENMLAGREYTTIYSRAMWAPSMYAAMLFKNKHPELEWIAEFSDPMSLDVEGLPRGAEIPDDEPKQAFVRQLLAKYPELDGTTFSVFSLAEYLVYAFADTIMFTNSHQMETMIEHIASGDLQVRVRERAVVSNHPTLPRSYYEINSTDYELDPDVLNLGYFGEFYSSRSIVEVTSAMRALPPHFAQRVHLHVFTNYIPASEGNQRPRNLSKAQFDALVERAYEGVGAEGIEDRVTFNASLPFLDFLATSDKFDYLIVNDAKSGEHHSRNPYLPSKWSDYSGSKAKVWGFVEEGSMLSGKPIDVKTPVGDAFKARQDLWDMILAKFPGIEADAS